MSTPRVPIRTRISMVLAGSALVAVGLLGPAGTGPVTAATPKPHWGNYQWAGGAQKADVRAFWLFDRTGDPNMHVTIKYVVNAWNGARDAHPELPFIAIYQDDDNAGRCFVNQTAGFSVASACMIPPDIHGVKAIAARNPDASGHLVGAAFAVSQGLGGEEALTVVCHAFGHVMGLDDSANTASCMHPSSTAGQVRWYDSADASAILALYAHSDTPGATTTTTTAPSTTSTTVGSTTTTSTSTPASTSTTVASTTTTTTTTPEGLCEQVPLPVVCTTTTTVATTTTTSAGAGA